MHDLAKHYSAGVLRAWGPTATAAWKRTDEGDFAEPAYEAVDAGDDPANLAAWTEFHDQVGQLPDDERAVFDLLWYQELSQSRRPPCSRFPPGR